MRPTLHRMWFLMLALLLGTAAPAPALGVEPGNSVKNKDTPCEKQSPWCAPQGAARTKKPKPAPGANLSDGELTLKGQSPFTFEFSLGPFIGTDSFGASLALRMLWRVSGRHHVGMMLEYAGTTDGEDDVHATYGLVGYRYAAEGGGYIDLLPVYTIHEYNNLQYEQDPSGEPQLTQRKGIALKLRAGFGGTAGGVRIGLAFEVIADLYPLFGVCLYLGGGP